ncbi:MAG: hypothetical protein R3Y63_15000 [Eubacteriales bacterium]
METTQENTVEMKKSGITLFKPLMFSVVLLVVQSGIFLPLPKIIREYFHNSDLSPAESMLSAAFYSTMGPAIISILLSVCLLPIFIPAFIKMFKSLGKSENYFNFRFKLQLVISSFLFYGLAVTIPVMGAMELQNFDRVMGFYSDLQEVKNGELDTTNLFYYSSHTAKGSPLFNANNEFEYTHLLMVHAPQIEFNPETTSYFLPWKSESQKKYSDSYIWNGEPEENNQNATVYQFTHTSYHRIVTGVEEVK